MKNRDNKDKENFRWPSPVHTAWLQLYWVVAIAFLTMFLPVGAREHLALDSSDVLYGIFTAIFIHASFVHLISNMAFLLALSWVITSTFKRFNLSWAFIVSAVVANVVTADEVLKMPNNVISDSIVGSSGGIMGLLGVAVVSWLYLVYRGIKAYRKGDKTPKLLKHSLLKFFAILVTVITFLNVHILIVNPLTVVVHFTGLAIGLVYGIVFLVIRCRNHEAILNEHSKEE